MEKKEWTLLAISCANGESISPAQLQKSLFLPGKMFPEKVNDNYYKFVPYNYGPFCKEIYEDAEALEQEGYINIKTSIERGWKEYSATKKGLEYAEELRREISDKVYNYLYDVVNWARSITFQQLISTIYENFPEFRENSVFEGTV